MARPQHPPRRRFAWASGSTAGSAPGSASASPAIVIVGMDRLRGAEEHEQADRLALRAATADPATAAGMLRILHAAGRHGDAEILLRLIASADAATCGGVVHALSESVDAADAAALVTLLQDRPAAELAVAAAAFDRSATALRGSEPDPERVSPSGNPLAALLATRPSADLVAEVARLRADGRHDDAAALLAVIGRGSPDTVYTVSAELAARRIPADAETLLSHYARDAAAPDLAHLFLRLTHEWENAAVRVAPIVAQRSDAAAFLTAMQTLVPQVSPEDCVGLLAERLTSEQTAALCSVLISGPTSEAADDLIGWCARRDDARNLQAMLHRAEMHAAAYHLAERRAEYTGRYEP